MSLFSIHNLHLEKGNQVICHGLSIDIAHGELVIVRGKNGSGKTSLLRVLSGLSQTDADLLWRGEVLDWLDSDIRNQMIYIGHKSALRLELTARENLSFYMSLKRQKHHLIDEALTYFQLNEVADTLCAYLSAGQCRRIILSRLLIEPASLWILDEPTSSLDSCGIQLLETLLEKHLSKKGVAVIATHRALEEQWNDVTILSLPYA